MQSGDTGTELSTIRQQN